MRLATRSWINSTDAFDTSGMPALVRQKALQITEQARASLRLAIRAGVPIAYGTDAGVFAHGKNAVDFPVLVEAGMTPAEAIRAATIDAAALLGADDRGALETGQLADIIAVRGNPLESVDALARVRFVMKGGAVYRWGALIGPPGGLTDALLRSLPIELDEGEAVDPDPGTQ